MKLPRVLQESPMGKQAQTGLDAQRGQEFKWSWWGNGQQEGRWRPHVKLLREMKAFLCSQGMYTWITTADKSLYETESKPAKMHF